MSCAICNKLVKDAIGNYHCQTNGKTFLLLSAKEYFSPAEAKLKLAEQGVNCSQFGKGQGVKQIQGEDPLVSFIKKHKPSSKLDDAEQKIIEAYDRNMGGEVSESKNVSVEGEVNFRSGLGWVVASCLAGVLISLFVLGLIKF